MSRNKPAAPGPQPQIAQRPDGKWGVQQPDGTFAEEAFETRGDAKRYFIDNHAPPSAAAAQE